MNASRSKFSSVKPFALLLAGVIAGSLFSEALRPAPAVAQDRSANRDPEKSLPPEAVLNAAEQRKQIITPLNLINDRLTRIEGLLASGLKVKVTEMPPVTMKEPVSNVNK